MPVDITMPRLSDTMEAGTVIKWHVKEGDEVASGRVVADIETDKATMEMQVFDDGRIARILVPAGQQVRVGTKIAELSLEDDAAGAAPRSEPAAAAPAVSAVSAPSAPSAPAPMTPTSAAPPAPSAASAAPEPAPDGARMRVSPVARRMAEEMGIDLAQIRGSGPGGRIIKRDVEAAGETRAAAPGAAAPAAGSRMAPLAHPATGAAALAAPVRTAGPGAGALSMPALQSIEVPLSGVRQTIARRLVESKSTIPHYQVSMSFDMDALMALRSQLNTQLAAAGVKLSVNDFVVRACALAMARHPFMNASWAGDRILLHQGVNVGVAVALDEEKGGGLLVATVRDADRKSLRQISQESKALSEKARTRGLGLDEMSDSTFTISNLGMFGVEHFTAIINPPNSAILACGAALQKPVVREGALAVGWEMTATLSLDHRVIDGAMAARWLQDLKQLLEHPTLLLV